MKDSYLVDEFTCEICGTRTKSYTNSPDEYVRRNCVNVAVRR